ncbi:substrate-binding domain-containing protein, partial [Vibrio sp. 10N.261.49.A5]
KLQELSWCALGDGFDMQYSDSKTGNEVKDDDIETELTLILLGHDTRTRDFIDEGLPSLNLPNHRVMEVGSVDAQIDWAEAGFGVAIIPEFAISTKQYLNSKVTPLTNFSSTSLGYIVRQNQVLSKATKQLLGWVNDEITLLQSK